MRRAGMELNALEFADGEDRLREDLQVEQEALPLDVEDVEQ